MSNEILELILRLQAIEKTPLLEIIANFFTIITGLASCYLFYLEFVAGVKYCGQRNGQKMGVYLHNNSLREKDIESIEVKINEIRGCSLILAQNIKIPPRTTVHFEKMTDLSMWKISEDRFDYKITRIRIKYRWSG